MPEPNDRYYVPDLIEPTEGWRCWAVPSQLPKFGLPPKLFSVAGTSGYFWKPRVESVAKCKAGCDAHGGPGIPGESCSCGFYSAKTRKHLMTMPYYRYNEELDGKFRIIGLVSNWGKVIECSLGWRAEKSYPAKLFIPYEAWRLAKPLAEAYGVPVQLDNFLKPRAGENVLV